LALFAANSQAQELARFTVSSCTQKTFAMGDQRWLWKDRHARLKPVTNSSGTPADVQTQHRLNNKA
jgi:hypothetical protein